MADETTEMDAWLAQEIAKEEAEIRRIAKRDGIPSEWVETVLAKIRGEAASRA
jgi:hypothetical protein